MQILIEYLIFGIREAHRLIGALQRLYNLIGQQAVLLEQQPVIVQRFGRACTIKYRSVLVQQLLELLQFGCVRLIGINN